LTRYDAAADAISERRRPSPARKKIAATPKRPTVSSRRRGEPLAPMAGAIRAATTASAIPSGKECALAKLSAREATDGGGGVGSSMATATGSARRRAICEKSEGARATVAHGGLSAATLQRHRHPASASRIARAGAPILLGCRECGSGNP
jgi:hypothetical protein